MKEIKLTQGKVALVDDEDFERVNVFKWHLQTHPKWPLNQYACRWVREERTGKYKLIRMHRFILNLESRKFTDHIDGNGLNNQKDNLRECTPQENAFNRRKLVKSSSSFKGVWWEEKQHGWRSAIRHNNKLIHLGCFGKEIDAANAYSCAAKELFGNFAVSNNKIFVEAHHATL